MKIFSRLAIIILLFSSIFSANAQDPNRFKEQVDQL